VPTCEWTAPASIDLPRSRRYNDLRKRTLSALFRRSLWSRTVAAATLKQWVDSLQARGRYTFQRDEAVAGSGLSRDSVRKALNRLTHRGRVVKIKDYFFAVVPLEYQSAGSPPPSWFIDDLMKAMARPYYVGLLSAAGQHGASHQQPQEFQVVTERYLRPVGAGRTKIHFFTSQYMPKAACVDIKTPTGSMRVSTPETTAVDLVRFVRSVGHLDHVAAVLSELAPLCQPKPLVAAAKWVDDLPNMQRLGYILDQVRRPRITIPLHDWVLRQKPQQVPLRPGRPVDDAGESRRWRLLVNGPIEVQE